MKGFIGKLFICLLLLSGIAVASYSATSDEVAVVQTAGVTGIALAAVVAPLGDVDKTQLKDYFERYPNSMEVYVNGGVLFHDRGAADSYGQGETKRYTRADICSKEDNIPSSLPPIAEVDINALSYDQLKYYVADLGLQPAGNKKADLIDALTAYKDNLKQEQ